jgi:hypothetical protein
VRLCSVSAFLGRSFAIDAVVAVAEASIVVCESDGQCEYPRHVGRFAIYVGLVGNIDVDRRFVRRRPRLDLKDARIFPEARR